MCSFDFVSFSDTCDDFVEIGKDYCSIRLHSARTRCGIVILRGHAEGFVQFLSKGWWALLFRAGERVTLWDIVAKRCVRTIVRGLCTSYGEYMHTIYAPSLGGCKYVRVHYSRTPGVEAVLSLLLHWLENRIWHWMCDSAL